MTFRRSSSAVIIFSIALLASCGGHSTGAKTKTTTAPPDSELRLMLAMASVTSLSRPDPAPPALVALGKNLFYDKLLSGNRNISCATCHSPIAATGDGLPVSLGEGATGASIFRTIGNGKQIPRNANPLFDLGLDGVNVLFWDGRISFDEKTASLTTPEPAINGTNPIRADIASLVTRALAAQALFPPTSRDEMRGQTGSNELADAPDVQTVWSLLMVRLVGTANGTSGGVDGYRTLFAAAYPGVGFDALNFGHAARAIAAFETESWTALGSRFDAYVAGDDAALTDQEKRGLVVFYRTASCANCHSGPLLTDQGFHALSVPQIGPGKLEPGEDRGRGLVTTGADDYKFRTPPLRNVALTGPWMHDGAFATLEGAVRHHLDARASYDGYDPAQLRADFAATLDLDPSRRVKRLNALDGAIVNAVPLTDAQVSDLIAFLNALSDLGSFKNAADQPPLAVPSGLPVRD